MKSANSFFKLEPTVKVLTILLFMVIMILMLLLVDSCVGDVCGDIWDRSPGQLIDASDHVLLAQYEGADTLITLGTFDYMDYPHMFRVVEHMFTASRKQWSGVIENQFFLWNFEFTKVDGYSHSIDLDAINPVLVYGNVVTSSKKLFLVMASGTPERDLARVIQGKSPKFDWYTREVDSLLAGKILASTLLTDHFNQRKARGQVVLYCPEHYCLTMEDYFDGSLCYYDSSGIGHSVSAAEYLSDLDRIAGI